MDSGLLQRESSDGSCGFRHLVGGSPGGWNSEASSYRKLLVGVEFNAPLDTV